MRRVCLLLLTVFIAVTVFAQTVALPQEREKLGGTEPTQRITREVMHRLLMLPTYSVWDDLAFKVNGNTVTLLGAVVNPATKSSAEDSVKKIEGVDKVIDNIEALPPSSQDDALRRSLYRAIYGFDGLSRYSWGAVPSIHIIVKGGHVRLVGVVDSAGDKQIAVMQAKSVPGVFDVQDDLQVGSSYSK